MFKIALICGGPSLERGISLNSARSVLDHLASELIEIIPIYVDYQKFFYLISTAQLYSNTPADFDFKLKKSARAMDREELKKFLRNADLVFPVIHGIFGEDGELQKILEEIDVPFIGTGSQACAEMFCKYHASQILHQNRFPTFMQLEVCPETNNLAPIKYFFEQHQLKRAIVKPTMGGSSIGVTSVQTPEDAFEKNKMLFQQGIAKRTLIEPFCEGIEFTVVVLQNQQSKPVALIPTEIEMSYQNHQIFDYRKKYLPTNQTTYHTPARFDETIIQGIRQKAEAIFTLFHMRDFARLDGWLLNDGTIYFTDLNPISGMEQNSFLFRQASLLGLTHRDVFRLIITSACLRWKLTPPIFVDESMLEKKKVHVLFGGKNAERQVSLMSGTNVWLKLLRSSKYHPIPFFYGKNDLIWQLPYAYTLDHTVEEILHRCLTREASNKNLPNYFNSICEQLGIPCNFQETPSSMSLQDFYQLSASNQAFVFIAMHGGEGENGILQKELEKNQLNYNGSCAKTSSICMDKFLTGQVIEQLKHPNIFSLPKECVEAANLFGQSTKYFLEKWNKICISLRSNRLIIKPRQDGCSAGIVLLESGADLEKYFAFIQNNVSLIPKGSFSKQKDVIEMPSSTCVEYLLEPYIETDRIILDQGELIYEIKEGWVELTVGVLEHNQIYRSLNPSITLAEGAVLSLEEKFQGGTGVNLTPPPEKILAPEDVSQIKFLIEKTADALQIQNYARLDIFYHRETKKMVVIEANTLPGLTPSTVFYQQGLAEKKPLNPLSLLEIIISSKLELSKETIIFND
ncbi:D-alanine--D-alanine ligase [Candidatus Protochlamydia amoebophila]|uniref:hypothetical protein n=1 Tax=Candidatus Protochlamydia amoebophila TaxID=362787 RepID=UPI001BC91A43|nr:hypothetical protein [Candidatus Protochlamydia amoebophila]MBS4164294.1 D-alanine--D-alanine ligase [Candidatus Protochlamydia amoebophila]